MVIAAGSYPAGRWFESDRRYQNRLLGQAVKTSPFHGGNTSSILVGVTNGELAQLGEHLPYKQGVTGSSPVLPTRLSGCVCWPQQKRVCARHALFLLLLFTCRSSAGECRTTNYVAFRNTMCCSTYSRCAGDEPCIDHRTTPVEPAGVWLGILFDYLSNVCVYVKSAFC